MAKYTFEDIEILRQKSGISYEEAVNLLEYHNGSLARALVDLEKTVGSRPAPPLATRAKAPKACSPFSTDSGCACARTRPWSSTSARSLCCSR